MLTKSRKGYLLSQIHILQKINDRIYDRVVKSVNCKFKDKGRDIKEIIMFERLNKYYDVISERTLIIDAKLPK
jgi:hypothetical protein